MQTIKRISMNISLSFSQRPRRQPGPYCRYVMHLTYFFPVFFLFLSALPVETVIMIPTINRAIFPKTTGMSSGKKYSFRRPNAIVIQLMLLNAKNTIMIFPIMFATFIFVYPLGFFLVLVYIFYMCALPRYSQLS